MPYLVVLTEPVIILLISPFICFSTDCLVYKNVSCRTKCSKYEPHETPSQYYQHY